MHAIPSVCPNCGDALRPSDRFCSHCGQDTANHPPTLWEFIHEFATHYVALEGALWRTLKALVFHPGFLTTEYLAGRRMRYVLPLRLLLTLGFVFFLLAKLPMQRMHPRWNRARPTPRRQRPVDPSLMGSRLAGWRS